MQNKKNRFIFILVFGIWLLNASYAYSQTQDEISIERVLKSLEKTYNIRFSFASNDLSSITIKPISSEDSLEKSIDYINKNTPVFISQISERYYSVILKSNAKQFICIRILDFDNSTPLEAVTANEPETNFGSISNSDGIIYIPKNLAKSHLIINHLGYKTNTISLTESDSSSCKDYYLFKDINELEEIFLQDIFTKGIYKQLNGSFKFKTQNFGLLPGLVETDVLQMTQTLPGVESIDETISNINIRGGSNSENLLLWNGIKMYQSGHFFGLISAFNPYITNEVSVIKNGTQARYGESVSGVIDMQSDNEVSTKFSGGITQTLLHTNAFINVPITNKFSIQVSGRRSINEVYESLTYETYSDRIFQDTEISNIEAPNDETTITISNNFFFYDFSTKALWDFSERDKIRASFLIIKNKLFFDEVIETETFKENETSTLAQESIAGSIDWHHKWNKNLTSSVLFYVSQYSLDAINLDLFSNQMQVQANEVLETGLKIDVSYTVSSKLILQGGYQFIETGISNTQDVNIPLFRSFIKEVLQAHVFYAEGSLKPFNNNTTLTTGIRFNYYSKFNKLNIEPRLNIHQNLGNGFALEILGELKSQTTTQRIDFQSDFLGIEKRRWSLANNDDIPIIKSKQASIGLVYNKKNWILNIEGFIKKVNGITSGSQGFQNQFQFVKSIGSYESKGIELVINKKLSRFSTWLSYTYMVNDYSFQNLSPSSFPNNLDIRHSGTAALSYDFNRFKVAFGVNWHTGKPTTLPISNQEETLIDGIQYEFPNSENLSNYFRTDFSAEYKFITKESFQLKANISILNLFNQDNILNQYYVLQSNSVSDQSINKIKNHSLGFTPNISLEIAF